MFNNNGKLFIVAVQQPHQQQPQQHTLCAVRQPDVGMNMLTRF